MQCASPSRLIIEEFFAVLVVKRGGKLDQLRGEAYRIARDNNTDWWAEAADTGTKFCFENANAKASFRAVCERENVHYT